jgi:hypothetical protein
VGCVSGVEKFGNIYVTDLNIAIVVTCMGVKLDL